MYNIFIKYLQKSSYCLLLNSLLSDLAQEIKEAAVRLAFSY